MLVDRITTRIGQPEPPSLYASQPDLSTERTTPLHGDAEAEVAIVGAGLTGLSTALHLAELGVECVVLEANTVGWGASGRNGGQINPGLKLGPDAVARDLGPEAVRFAQAAPDQVFRIVADHRIDCEIRRGGTLRAACDAPSLAGLADLAAQMRRHGIEAHMVSGAEMAKLVGTSRYMGGLFDPAGGQLNPLKFVRGLARAARLAGVRIHEETAVTAAISKGGRWCLATSGGRVIAERVLFATNGYSDALVPGLRRSLLPVFSAIVASRTMPAALTAQILPDGQSLFEVGPVTTYYRVDAAGRLVFGGRGRMRDAAGPAAFGGITRYAEQLWPELRTIGWEHGWNGRVALTADHYPHLHRIGKTGLACVGYNGRGVAMATAMGVELAKMMAGDGHHEPVLPVSPIRPIMLQPFWPIGVVPALAWARLRARFAD